MPWSEQQMKAIRARAHGWMPREGKKGPFGNVSEEKAREMMEEGTRSKKSKVQRRALSGGK